MKSINQRSLELHEKNKGKLAISSKVPLENLDDLSLAYSPGVAAPCVEIHKNNEDVYKYTSKGNMVAVITDGSAVLGLGNIGPLAALPVMEGKCLLFKKFANVDAVPICLNTQDPKEIISIVKNIAPTYGGINLEDISFPRCVEIEETLRDELDIPLFHDDQHGTAIVVCAALINACKLVGKEIEKLQIVISGLGAAGSAIAKLLRQMGATKIYATNSRGAVSKLKNNNELINKLLNEHIIDTFDMENANLKEIIKDADCFIGVSVKDILTIDMVNSMSEKPIVFALANPDPEISYENVKKSNAFIYATGRSDIYNQINNVLAFPGIFHGAFKAKSKKITDEMYETTARAIANLIKDKEITREYIIPSPFDERVMEAVSDAVYKKAKEQGICR
ncbi:MAG TPA: NADP-dependent malic enzyme [Acholeplasmataceae bacterium]|nr:NADP-dependent malic enzyme [Acholeplasmataceae bacterium]